MCKLQWYWNFLSQECLFSIIFMQLFSGTQLCLTHIATFFHSGLTLLGQTKLTVLHNLQCLFAQLQSHLMTKFGPLLWRSLLNCSVCAGIAVFLCLSQLVVAAHLACRSHLPFCTVQISPPCQQRSLFFKQTEKKEEEMVLPETTPFQRQDSKMP